MSDGILDKIEEEESYYDKSFTALKWGLICIVCLIVILIASFLFSGNEILDYIFSLLFLFLFLGGLLAFGLYGLINGVISFWKKEDYGVMRTVVIIACFLLFAIPLCLTMMFIVVATRY